MNPAAGLQGKQVRHDQDTRCRTPCTRPHGVEETHLAVRRQGTAPGRGLQGPGATHAFSAGVRNLHPGDVESMDVHVVHVEHTAEGYRRCYLGLQEDATPSSHPAPGRREVAKGTLQTRLWFWICSDGETILDFLGGLNATTGPLVTSRNRRQAERTGPAMAGLRTEGPHGNHDNEVPTT